MVLDLCEDAKDRLTKEVFIRLAQATARILLVVSASEKTLVDVNDADDGVAAENAEIIHLAQRPRVRDRRLEVGHRLPRSYRQQIRFMMTACALHRRGIE
jgi:hypothetical protein